MSTAEPIPTTPHDAVVVHDLCDMLLEIAGRDTNRLPSVIRHTRILDRALPHMTPVQRADATARIRRLQTKWGCLLPEAETQVDIDGIVPETLVVQWASQRRAPERLLRIVYHAALAVLAGETSLSVIFDRGYCCEDDGLVAWVTYDSFKEWLLQLRVARPETKGVYRPGLLCRWWVEKMAPSRDRTSAYAACLKQLELQQDRPIRVR